MHVERRVIAGEEPAMTPVARQVTALERMRFLLDGSHGIAGWRHNFES
jgi:hypothetical protein